MVAGFLLLPAAAVGARVSNRTTRHLDRHWLRAAVLLVSGLAGIAAILHSLVCYSRL